MKPYRQGDFSQCCSIYSTINAIKRLGIKLKTQEWQDLYDYIITELNNYNFLYDTLINGANAKRLETIFVYASDWLKKHKKIKLEFKRQYWSKRPIMETYIDDIKKSLDNKQAVINCINSPHISHYTNISRISKDRLFCFDSCNLKNIELKNIKIEQGGHYQIKYRCVYFLSVQSEYTTNARKRTCANKVKNTGNFTIVKPSHKAQLHTKEQDK